MLEGIDLDQSERAEFLAALETRFLKHPLRHPLLRWESVRERLEAQEAKLLSLKAMEATGGEPDVIGYDAEKDLFIFCDCSAESPAGRRSLCYDRAALDSRKEAKPANDATSLAESMGLRLLTEEEYVLFQKLGPFDQKTSSWIKTPDEVRKKGGALFGDYRYGRAFIYHNGADSYYGARGFRGILLV